MVISPYSGPKTEKKMKAGKNPAGIFINCLIFFFQHIELLENSELVTF